MKRYILVIMGKTGQGKTTFLIEKIIPAARKPVFILDPKGEFGVQRTGGFQSLEGLIFRDIDRLYAYIAAGGENQSNIYIFRPHIKGQVQVFFAGMVRLQNITVVVEEAPLYCDPYSIDPYFEDLMYRGRLENIDVIAVGQRAAQFNKSITSQSDCVVTFRQDDPQDIKALSYKGDTTGVKSLGVHEYRVLGPVPERFRGIVK